jgi:hypothetical protein
MTEENGRPEKPPAPWLRSDPDVRPGVAGAAWCGDVEFRGVWFRVLQNDDQLVSWSAGFSDEASYTALFERAMSMMWDREANRVPGNRPPPLSSLFLDGSPVKIKTDHDRRLAEVAVATVIQAFGTSWGRYMLCMADDQAGRDKARLDPLVKAKREFLKAVGEVKEEP